MPTPIVGKATRITPRLFATVSIGCFVYGVLALILMHVLRPDYTPASHMISDYAVGRYGWVMTTWFISMSCGCLMMLLGLALSGPGSLVGWLGTLLLGIPAIGLVVSAIFPTDLQGAPATATGHIHDLSFLANIVSIVLAMVLLSAGFGRHPRWRSYQRTAAMLTSLVVPAFVFQFLTLRRGAPYGIANRLFVAVLFAWMLETSIRLRALGGEQPARRTHESV